jgi:KDO2-lipid IV(A) lauroyltransferase
VSRPRDRATVAAYRGAAAIAQRLPVPAGVAAARVAGRLAPWVMPGRRAMVARHQRRVLGHADRAAVAAVFASYARYWYEMFRLPADVRAGLVDAHFTVDGYEHVEQGVAAGRGVILALPHLGGWEWAAAWMAGRGHRMLAVVEPVEPVELFDWFVRQRRLLGLDVVPLGADTGRQVASALRAGRIVCLLSDRDLTGDGVPVRFLGEPTTLPGGPATLALRTGAALLPLAVYFRAGRHHHAVIRPPIPVAREGRLRADIIRITQLLADELEALVRAAPEQWHLMQPNWPSDRG